MVKFIIPLNPPKGDKTCSLDPLQKCVPLRSTHIFRGLAGQRDCSFRALRSFLTTALQSQTRNAVSLSGLFMSGSLSLAAVSSLVTQRLSAFRSFLAPAYRLCCAPRLSAESSEPFGKGFVPQPLPTVSSALTASSRSASTRSLTSRRRPDSHARSVMAEYRYSTFVQAAERPLYPARTSSRPPPAAPYRLACSRFYSFVRCPLTRPLPKEQNSRARPY